MLIVSTVSPPLQPVRAIANVREPFAAVDGHVQYSTIDADEAKKYLDGEIVFNGEDEVHLPLLKVEETLDAALVRSSLFNPS